MVASSTRKTWKEAGAGAAICVLSCLSAAAAANGGGCAADYGKDTPCCKAGFGQPKVPMVSQLSPHEWTTTCSIIIWATARVAS